jgi:acetyl-CoA carboxylase biotin carboxyl carrier protein
MAGPDDARAKDKLLNIKELRELLQLLDDRDISEFELEEGGMKLRVRKASGSPGGPTLTGLAVPVMAPGSVPAPLSPATPAASAPVAERSAPTAPANEDEGLFVVKSPIVGTFFRSPDPNAPPFVDVGDHVRPGQVMCIVEAMKLMNEIEAEVGGIILKAHAENGQPVQYGEPLFTLRPD